MNAGISYHLHQFAIIPNMFDNAASNNFTIYEKMLCKLDWEGLLKIDYLTVDNLIQIYLEKINILSCISSKY